MSDLREVFEVATQKVRPDPGALDRQHVGQRRRVARRRAGVYTLVAGIVIAGLVVGWTTMAERDRRPATPPVEDDAPVREAEGLPPTIERLTGIWYEDRGSGYWQAPLIARFAADGAFSMGGVSPSSWWTSGTYEVDGHRIRFAVTGGACGGSTVWTWDADIVADGRLEAVNRGSAATQPGAVGECIIPLGEPYNFTRVSPTSAAAAEIDPAYFGLAGAPDERLSADTTFLELQDAWLVEGTGFLFNLDRSGRYALDDNGELATAPDDSGTVEIGAGTLTFISGPESRVCSGGDALLLTNVRSEGGRLLATVRDDACARGLDEEITLLYLNVDTP